VSVCVCVCVCLSVCPRRATGGAPKTTCRIREAGAGHGRRPAAEGGVLNITAAVWTAGFHWWHSGNKKRTQNVSEYMLVLALCLVNNIVVHACAACLHGKDS